MGQFYYETKYSSIIISHQLSCLFEMKLEPDSLDWNGNELEHEVNLEDMKRTFVTFEQ